MYVLYCFTLLDPRRQCLHVEKVFQIVNSLLRPGELWRSLLHLIALSYKMQGGGWWEKVAKEKGGDLGHACSYQNIKIPDL